MTISGKWKYFIELIDDGDKAENFDAQTGRHILENIQNVVDGTADTNIDTVFSDRRTLTKGASESLDLAGVLLDPYGRTITFTALKMIFVRNRNSASGDTLHVKGYATNGFPWFVDLSDKGIVLPGGFLWWYDPVGVTVTAGTGDIIQVTEAGGTNSVVYDVLFAGEGSVA